MESDSREARVALLFSIWLYIATHVYTAGLVPLTFLAQQIFTVSINCHCLIGTPDACLI